MASKNSIRMVVGAGLALAAGVAFAAVSENFEDDNYSGTWTGGTVVTPGSHGTIAVGSPMDSGADAKCYAVAGEATCANSDTANTYAKADFLVCVTEATTDDLVAPDDTARIAVAAAKASTASTPPKVSIYTNNKWVTATSATFKLGTWQRLTLVFDYANGKCQVLLDGVPVVSSADAYLSADATTSGSGSWYALANGEQNDDTGSVASLKFVGLANIDDVLIAGNSEAAVPAYTGTADVTSGTVTYTVDRSKLAAWGVSSDNLGVTLAGNQTVAQKLEAGLDPTSADFAPTAMTLAEGNNGTLTATVAVPFEEAYGGAIRTYGVAFTDGSGKSIDGVGPATGLTRDSNGNISFPVPADAAKVPVLKMTVSVTATTQTTPASVE